MREIDRVLAAVLRYRRPGYIELPRDMVTAVPAAPYTRTCQRAGKRSGGPGRGRGRGRAAHLRRPRPVILAGVEIHRFGLQDRLLALAEGAGIPMAATMLGKSVVSERHPLFVGIYEGGMGREEVTAVRRGERLRAASWARS